MKFSFKTWLARVLVCSALMVPVSGLAEQQEKISLNFVNANIDEVVKAVAHITKRNFVVDPRVKGTINIISTDPVDASLAYDILLSALRLQGFASVESKGVTKVMPEADAKLHLDTAKAGRLDGDKLVTRVYKLQYESAAQLVPVLRPIIAPNNIVTAYPGSNTLVVTDYASNLKRIEQIVFSIDQPSDDVPIILPVKHTSALDLAQTVSQLMDNQQTGRSKASNADTFVIMADARTNSLLIRASDPTRLARVRELIAQLDVATSEPGNIHVVYLKNAEAATMAETLRAILSGNTSSSTASSNGSSAQPAQSQNTAGASRTARSSSSSSGGAASGGGMIQADNASNALIIIAADAVYNNLRAVIEKLDVRRAQVFVEALIVEVTAEKAAEFGVQWQDLTGVAKSSPQVIGGTNFGAVGTNIVSASNNVASVGNGLNIGVVRGVTNLPGVGEVVNLAVLAKALETDTNANILSTPNLLTLDNEEAKIIIGQNVPFITGSYAQTGNANTASPFQTIERQDVGLTLSIRPQVSQGGTVKLDIFQEVSSVQDQSVNNSAGVTTNKRSLESTILAEEGQIIVLGGLIQDSVSDGEDKVPLLGDIPIIGNLFRYEKRSRSKTNLMVFIRPYVLRSAEASNSLTQDRYDYLRGEQKSTQLAPHPLLPDMRGPGLPDLELLKNGNNTNLPQQEPKSVNASGVLLEHGEQAVSEVEEAPQSHFQPASGDSAERFQEHPLAGSLFDSNTY